VDETVRATGEESETETETETMDIYSNIYKKLMNPFSSLSRRNQDLQDDDDVLMVERPTEIIEIS
jgi:hypothetical protein